MKKTIRLEEHEKTAVATVLDMFNQAFEDKELVKILNDCGSNIGETVEDAYEFLSNIFIHFA